MSDSITITILEVETRKRTVYNHVNCKVNINHRVERDSTTKKFPKLTVTCTLKSSTNRCRCLAVPDISEDYELFEWSCDLNEQDRIMDDIKEVFIKVYTHKKKSTPISSEI